MNTLINILEKTYYLPVNYQLKNLLFASASINHIVNHNTSNQTNFINNKSTLFEDIYLQIKMSGPISVANYMKKVLTHPTKGYYTNKDVFGHKGDFITSPEISQLFGEMIGVWIVNEYRKIHNKEFQIVELGPGTGTLLNDILRVFHQLGIFKNFSIHLVEISPTLSKIQSKNLCLSEIKTKDISNSAEKYYKRGLTKDNINVFWYKSILDIPEGFNIFIAQEFFDALPIYKFQRTNDGWFEVLVDIDPRNKFQEKFRFVLDKTDACYTILNKHETRDHVEISLESINIMQYISSAITQNGGFALIMDYGHNGNKTDTFRAFRHHEQCNPLINPGMADLTADVDFSLLEKAALKNNLLYFGPVNQQDFLIKLGINYRLMNLYKVATEIERKQLEFGYKKLMDSNEMGTCFKVASIFPYVLKDYIKKLPVLGFESNIKK